MQDLAYKQRLDLTIADDKPGSFNQGSYQTNVALGPTILKACEQVQAEVQKANLLCIYNIYELDNNKHIKLVC